MSTKPDVWPRGQKQVANPLSEPFKIAYDEAQNAAAGAWADFEKARDAAAASSVDLAGDEAALDHLDRLYGVYTDAAVKADTAEARWVRSLGAGLEPEHNGKGHGPARSHRRYSGAWTPRPWCHRPAPSSRPTSSS
jgi:hypothetical protein